MAVPKISSRFQTSRFWPAFTGLHLGGVAQQHPLKIEQPIDALAAR